MCSTCGVTKPIGPYFCCSGRLAARILVGYQAWSGLSACTMAAKLLSRATFVHGCLGLWPSQLVAMRSASVCTSRHVTASSWRSRAAARAPRRDSGFCTHVSAPHSVLVRNGAVVATGGSSKELLATSGRGAYTTCRTLSGHRVFGLSQHLQRIGTHRWRHALHRACVRLTCRAQWTRTPASPSAMGPSRTR